MSSMQDPTPDPRPTFSGNDSNQPIRDILLAESQAARTSFRLNLALMALAGLLIMVSLLFSARIESMVAFMEARYLEAFHPMMMSDAHWVLPVAGFIGGLIASISPCIVALTPLNLGYIGTLEAPSRGTAFGNALAFVAGMVLVLSLFGLISSFAGFVVVAYKGWITAMVGLIALVMGLTLADFWTVSLPESWSKLPSQSNAFLVGVIFALVASPCASPVLLALLGKTAVTHNQFLATITMSSYALGYTFVLFLAGFLTGLTKGLHYLRQYQGLFTQLSGILLIFLGIYYVAQGFFWFQS